MHYQFLLKFFWIFSVEKKQKSEKSSSNASANDEKARSKPAPAPVSKLDSNAYKSSAGSNYKFGVLAKIVRHLRARHLDKDDHPLTLEEILDETNQLDVGTKVKQWLINEALSSNPKIEVTAEQKFLFKPPYKIKDKKALLKLLKQNDLKGIGGIMLDDVQESLPNCEKILKNLSSEIIYVQRPVDKKKVMFYNDKTANFMVDDEFVKLWRSVAVENLDDEKIEEYLEKQVRI